MADTSSSIELGFIGFGNMAQAMAQGLVNSGALSGEHIHACAGRFDKLQATAEKLGVNAYREAAEVVEASDFVVLAVKPYLIEQVVESVRAWSGMPIIVVSARSEDADKIRALDAGADDYLTKPFSVEELLARIRTTLRRLSYAQTGGVVSEGSFDTGELHIDFDAGIATMDGEELHLTPIEYKLLCLLAHNADKVLTHQFILHEIWGTATKSDLASLRVFMGTLRKKIESDPAHPRYIQTHVGIGYRLVTQG